MKFLVDKRNKIIFGWSQKCGCSHIKWIFAYLNNIDIDNNLHQVFFNYKLPKDFNSYKIILIIRNPYERLISGFLQKYNKLGEQYDRWQKYKYTTNLTFRNFVNEMYNYGFGYAIEPNHFSPQLSQDWDDKIKYTKMYDINNIDYEYIEKLYQKKIPDNIKNKKGNHVRYGKESDKELYDTNIENINVIGKYKIYNFYTKDIESKVYEIYKKDFEYFANNRID